MKKLLSTVALVGLGLASAQTGFTLPTIPSEIAAPEGQKVVLTALGRGTQNYACQANAAKTGFEWAFKAPEANLFDPNNTKIASHYGGPTWEAPDGSRVVGEVKARVASPNTIPWLLLSAKSTAGTGVRQNYVHSAPVHHGRFSPKHGLRRQHGWQRSKNGLHLVVRFLREQISKPRATKHR